jgi:hypothetical protein
MIQETGKLRTWGADDKVEYGMANQLATIQSHRLEQWD